MKNSKTILFTLALITNIYLCSQTLSTVAGQFGLKVNAAAGTILAGSLIGDNGPATSASLNNPTDAVFDTEDNMYIVDANHYCIRKVNKEGVIKTIAGNGKASYSGDGALAIIAGVQPTCMAIDNKGNIYFTEPADHRIRKINAKGIISTFAGTGKEGFSGDGGFAIKAKLNYPVSIAVDAAGNVYFTDLNNNRVRKVNTKGIISTVVGTGETNFSGDGGLALKAALSFPVGVTTDADGNLYVLANSRIRKVDKTGVINTVAGNGKTGLTGDGGKATEASLNNPHNCAIDASGVMYIADTENNVVRKVDASGIITTIAGNGQRGHTGDGDPALESAMHVNAVSLDTKGNLFITDASNGLIRKLIKE